MKHQNLIIAIIMCLTMGLAPFTPEPHLFGKIKWVMGGAVGMQPMDWFDLILHGAPWLYLVYVLSNYFFSKKKIPPQY
jgi:hypothetical protein